jgi:hypothetical protein
VAAGGLILLTNSQTVLESAGVTGGLVGAAALLLAAVWVGLIVWAVRQERQATRLERDLDRELDTLVA